MRFLPIILSMILLGATGYFSAEAEAVVYLEIIEVPASAPSTPKKNPFAFGKKNQSQPEPVVTLSERFALTPEGKRKAKKWATSKSPNETHRIVVYKCPDVLKVAGIHNTEVIIDIGRQAAFLLVGGAIGLETEISTARSGKVTPKGSFQMTERVRNGKISNLYDVEMPYWMRLDNTPYGVHAGYLPGYPASAGCIRLPHVAAEVIYRHTARGSTVRILNSWRPSTNVPRIPDKNAKPPKAGRYNMDLMNPTIPKYPS